ncbi:DUF1983_domain-containing protein [Hexamita inflata]|uniref:DUF1983 domain-containing protein n=1 Tax=Hexamita inflata TaxID=28002 RepID=A0AA86V4P5_9EUKA|nr:DUF1983 domain-containing protein [Hexamita inflata]
MFIYTDNIQNTQINTQLEYVKVFAVFGFNRNIVQLNNVSINITIDIVVVKSALICIKCQVILDSSQLILIASGQFLSGIALEVEQRIHISDSNIQFRFNTAHGSGLVNIIPKDIEIQLQNSSITGTSLQESRYNGYIVSELQVNLQIFVSSVQVCSQINQSGTIQFQLIVSEPLIQNCSVCLNQFVVYGLCLNELLNGVIAGGQILCIFPFIFNESKCVCSDGYELNGTFCVNTVQQMTLLDIKENEATADLNQKISILRQNLTNEIQNLHDWTQNEIISLDTSLQEQIKYNISTLEGKLNQSIFKQELLTNSSFNQLDQRLFNNITGTTLYLETKIIQNASQLNSSLLARIQQSDQAVVANNTKMEQYVNTTRDILDLGIINNISALKAQLQSETATVQNSLVSNLVSNSSTLEQRIIGNSTVLQANIDSAAVTSHNDLEALRSQAFSNLTLTSSQLNTNLINNISTLKSYVDAQVLQTELRVNGNITAMKQYVDTTRDAIDSRLVSNITSLKSLLQGETNTVQSSLLANIISNSSTLEQRIIGNASTLQTNINTLATNSQTNLESLRAQAFSNQTQNMVTISSYIAGNVTNVNNNLLTQLYSNSSILEQRILGNASTVVNYINTQSGSINSQITSTKAIQVTINNSINQLLNIIGQIGNTLCTQNSKSYNNNGVCV